MNQKWFRSLFRRRVLIALLIAVQCGFLFYLIATGSRLSAALDQFLRLISILVILYIISKRDKGAYKTAWILLILTFPLFGGLFYLLFTCQSSKKRIAKRIDQIQSQTQGLSLLPGSGYDQARQQMGTVFPQVRYLQDFVGYPVYQNTATTYYPTGQDMLQGLLPQLRRAKRYIFLEFFIIQEGVMWNQILEILAQKAAEGVTVRVLYDDLGCFLKIPADFPQQLQAKGIACYKFNPFRPFLTAMQNNRDHRKIISIDGQVAFTGGINLADEYINAVERFGYWKDSGICLEGKAAWSLTLMFLQTWQLCTKQAEDFAQFYPWQHTPCQIPTDGFVLPYGDSPMDAENVGEHVYLQILNQATDYVYICTPYLIVDDSMVSALTLAAKRGVDVRILTPHIWDKRLVHMTTRSYYRELIQEGVKIYEFSQGFLHAKSFVCDDRIATVGTTNLDFRSLYLHFECGVWMYGTASVLDVKRDFLDTLPSCQQITEADTFRHPIAKFFQECLRIFAPLM